MRYAAAADRQYYTAIDRNSRSVGASRTSTNGDHSHTVTVSYNAFDTQASAGNTRPRWYALCFIMKQ